MVWISPFIRKASGILAAGFIFISGLAKLLDIEEFWASLSSWWSIPRAMAGPLAFAVPIIEIAVAGCYMLGMRRFRNGLILIVLLVIFQFAYTIEWIRGGNPKCACLGVLVRNWMFASLAQYVILRNLILIVMLAVSIISPSRRASELRGTPGRPHAANRAFTLMEMLVACAMVAVLIAMTLPILQRIRFSSRESRNLANLRTHTQLFTAYSAAHRDSFPAFMDTRKPLTTLTTESGIIATFPYFNAATAWNIAMADELYDGRWDSPAFTTPYSPGPASMSQYQWSCSFLADPMFYSVARKSLPLQLRAIRSDEVLFPSAKVILSAQRPFATRFAASGASPTDHAHVSMVDGHALSVVVNETMPSVHGGDGYYPDWGSFSSEHIPGIFAGTHTPDGVRGRDIR